MRTGLITRLRTLGVRHRRAVAVVCAVSAVAVAAAASHSQTSVGVLKVRLGGDQHQTRVVIELDRATRGALVTPPTLGDKVGIALAHVDVSGDMQGEGAGLVKSWRVEEAAGAAQVHLDLARPGIVRRRFLLPPG
ncbi:MAG: N-acetylmuramoyl-L-alanine amidase, partial [Caulobacteraceae bacterium]